MELGMHRDIDTFSGTHPSLTPTAIEIYKRTWFCAILIDIRVSFHYGRPLNMRFENWNTPFPDWQFEDLIQSNHNVDGEAFTALIKGACLSGRISDVVHGIGMLDRDTQLVDRLNGLIFWFNGVSERIANVMNTIDRYQPWGLMHEAGICYHCGVLMAYRLFGEK